ncbi:hypothetical protein [Teredinibacter turnerae]|uniref:hypothetical protein n=1 Tax=Teredinibacter turnerae TaxID=2426 RepID=UPI00036FD488|nr:hypothetical protein [Teredinibacter turnerae]
MAGTVEGERTNQYTGGDISTGAKYFGSGAGGNGALSDHYFQKNIKTVGVLFVVAVLGFALIKRGSK